jgi:hypothetical protein
MEQASPQLTFRSGSGILTPYVQISQAIGNSNIAAGLHLQFGSSPESRRLSSSSP